LCKAALHNCRADRGSDDGDLAFGAISATSDGVRNCTALRLGKKTEALLDEATTLHKQLDRYAYGAPSIRFSESDVDQARAAGGLVEFKNARPIIVDRSLYRELSKQAIKRTVEDLRTRVAEVAEQRKAAKASGRPVDPEAEARRERGRELRAIAEQAHGANLDLGWGLMNAWRRSTRRIWPWRSSSYLPSWARTMTRARTRRPASAPPSSPLAGSAW
jgi:hypothetical protein